MASGLFGRTGALLCVGLAIGAAGCGGGGGGGGSTGGSTPTPLVLAANSIVFGAANSGSTYTVTEMSPTGTNTNLVISSVPDTIALFAINPSLASEYALAADPTGAGTYGIYLAGSLSLKGATTLVAPAYSYVSSIAVTQNGQYVVYSATLASSGQSYLYVVPTAGGAAVQFGLSDGSTVSPADSNTIAFVAPLNVSGNFGDDQLFTQTISGGPSGTVTQLTTDLGTKMLPTFNPAGTVIAYWKEQCGVDTMYTYTLASSLVTIFPNTNSILAQGEAFSSDGTQLVIAGEQNGVGNIYTMGASGSPGPTSILSNAALLGNYGVFWTDGNGRLAGSIGGLGSASRRTRFPQR